MSTELYGSDCETENVCQFCGEDRFTTAFGQFVHSLFYCQQNPDRLEPPKSTNQLRDGPQYYYPVQQDLERQQQNQEQQK